MGVKFIEWFVDDFMQGIMDAMKCALGLIVIIGTLPIWIVPFIYWYFAEYERKEKEESTKKVGRNHKEVPRPDTEKNANTLIQNPSWIYETYFDPEREEYYKRIEKALGFKLFAWQKTYIEVREFRKYGRTTAILLADLLDIDARPIDFTRMSLGKQDDITRKEMRKLQEKLTEAGIQTRTIFWCEADKRKYNENKKD